MSSLYRPILKQAWQQTWRHKFLWFFGFFAAWLGTTGEYDFILRSFDRILEKGNILINFKQFVVTTGLFSDKTLQGIKQLADSEPLSLLIAAFVGLIILAALAFAIWVVITSQAGLIAGAKKIAGGKTVNFTGTISDGSVKFWPIFWLNVIYRIITFIIFLTLGVILALLFANTQAWSNLTFFIIFLVGFVLFIPLIMIISFITRYAACYVIIKNYRFGEALKQSLNLFFKNWLISLELSFLLLIIYLGMAIMLLVAAAIVIVPLLFLLTIFMSLRFVFGFELIALLAILAFAALSMVGVAIFSTFLWSCWTLLFIQLTEKGGESKLVRITSNFPSYLKRKVV